MHGSGALGDPRDMVKAELPEPQSPEDEMRHPPEIVHETGARPALQCYGMQGNLRGGGAIPSEGIQGDERGT